MKRLFLAGSITSVALLIWGCSSSDSGGGGGSSNDCPSAAKALCSKVDQCFHIAIQLTYGDMATCVARSQLGCEEDLSAPGSNTTPAKIGACADAVTAESCDDVLGGVQPSQCNIPGQRDDGQPCGNDSQCKSTHCKVAAGSQCGACAPLSPAGGSCSASSDCEGSSVCVNKTCAAPVAAGGACTSNVQCSGTLACKNSICTKPGGVGEACTSTADCDLTQGLACDPQSQTCKAVLFANPGEACGLVSGNLVVCSKGDCIGASVSQPGTCQAAPADGAACTDNGPSCLAPASCINGVCTIRSATSCG